MTWLLFHRNPPWGVEQTTATVEETAATMDEIARSANQLAGMAEELNTQLQQFKI